MTITKSGKGPVSDFLDAVKAEDGSFRTEHLYAMGARHVRFYEYRGKIGMDIYTPIKGRAAFQVTRVTSTGTRMNLGRVDSLPNQ